MNAPRPIASIAELLAHAIAIEREARERYIEFAERMTDRGNYEVADLFVKLARNERDHGEQLARQALGMELPPIDASGYAWLDAGAPETVPRDMIWHFMCPYHALHLALRAELRAWEFFEAVASMDVPEEVRAMAAGMAREEKEHVAWVEQALAREPAPYPDWNKVSD